MKRLLSGLVLVPMLLLSGCGRSDKAAEQYAQKLTSVLKSYQVQVGRKADAEREAYKRLSEIDARSKVDDVLETLSLDRSTQAEQAVDDLLKHASTGITAFEIKQRLRVYGDHDFTSTRNVYATMLMAEYGDRSEFLKSMDDLTIETGKIKTLVDALETLGKPKSQTQRMKDLANFVQAVDTEYNALECKDLTERIAVIEKEKQKPGVTPEQVKELDRKIGKLNDRKNSLKCTEDKK